MTAIKTSRIVLAVSALFVLTACANTIRGVGQDTANAVDATQQAGENVAAAAN